MIMRVVTIIIIYAITTPASADTLTCSTWLQITTCSSARRLREPSMSQWQVVTTGDLRQPKATGGTIVAVAGH